jgi:hypothetical protein
LWAIQTPLGVVIDNMEIEPVRRKIGAGYSEEQWHRSHVNCRYVHGYTYFPSPYARLAGLDDSIVNSYTVYTGSLCRDEVHNAEVRSDYEDDDRFFLEFPTLEEAVTFCLDDCLAPMDIELHRKATPTSAS